MKLLLTLLAGSLLLRGSCDGRELRSPLPAASTGVCRSWHHAEAFDLGGQTLVLRDGYVTEVDGHLIISGTIEDAAADGAGHTPGRLLLLHDSLGELPSPRPEGWSTPPVRMAAVGFSSGEWALVWSEAVRPDGLEGDWPRGRESELWTADWQGVGWGPPRRIAKGGTGLDWTLLPGAPDGGPGGSILLREALSVGEVSFRFGGLRGELRDVPIPSGYEPLAAGGMVEANGAALIALSLHGTDDATEGSTIALMETTDGGRSWSTARRLTRTSGAVSDLNVLRDGGGSLHLLWAEDFTTIRHLAASDIQATSFSLHRLPDGVEGEALLDGRVGIDACGQVWLVRQALSPSLTPGLGAFRWTGVAWEREDNFAGALALNLFDGQGAHGTWHLGWSGQREPATDEGDMKVWVSTP